jgi:ferrous iron transport protein B
VALVGSANSGKTTLFNLLTGSNYTTVNYPGATVEYALGACRIPDLPCRVMDTPGLASLLPASADEKVTVDALFGGRHRPDAVVAVVDGNQLSRHLYLVKQLQDVGFRPVVALTMGDLLKERGLSADASRLSQLLDCPVIALDPRRKDALPELGRLLRGRLAESAGGGKAHASPESYRTFAATMTEERVAGYYRALDEVEKLALVPASGAAAGSRPAAAPGGASGRTSAPGSGPANAPSHRADRILLHPVWGLLIFLSAMVAIFTSIFWLATPFMDFIDGGFASAIDWIKSALPASWMTDLLADGVVGGAGAVLVFLPQILILFLAMGYLEDSGYLARGAALVDRPLSKMGLNGKSFVPLLSGYACAIPAMMAARTIPNRFERNLTIFIIPLLSCSARLPVYTLFLAFLLPRDKPWLGGLALTGLYLSGLVIGAAAATAISKLGKLNKARGPSTFILELPALRRPVPWVVAVSTWHKAWAYLRKAGFTIVAISVGLWVLTHTPVPAAGAGEAGAAEAGEYVAVSNSYAAQVGHLIEPITRPMGIDWRGGVAMICGFAAREVFVGSLALMYRIEEEDEEGLTGKLLATMQEARFEDTGERIFTAASAIGLLVFFIIALQCFPTAAVSRNETGSWKIPAAQLVLYTGGAYVLAVIVVQGLRALGVP